MKVVCLLVCLGLARHGAGHIFSRQYVPQFEQFGEPLNYIDQAQYQPQARRNPPRNLYQEVMPVHYNEPAQPQVAEQASKEASRQNSDSMSSESNSWEDKFQRLISTGQILFADPDTPAVSQPASILHAPHGDAVNWRGIKFAVGPQSRITKKEHIAQIFRAAQDATKYVSGELKEKFHKLYKHLLEDQVEDAHLNGTQLSKKYQYPLEEHTVTTEDGYRLTLFRIQKQMNIHARNLRPKKVVFLMHGVQGSSDDFMLMGHQSLAFLLAEEGFEVWLGNARGSKYSRHHASKHSSSPDFWMYSNDEIALKDLPAMIDYTLKTSGHEKLYYVGYSQGTTNYFALASARPEYNQKVIKMFALSPMAYMTHVRSPLVRMIATNSKLYESLKELLQQEKFEPSKELLHTLGGQLCEVEFGCKELCSNLNVVMSGMNIENMDVAHAKIIMGHLPAGGSTRQIKQYAQAHESNEFRMYDYGLELNQKIYGSRLPPKYELNKITSPVALYYSDNDWLAHPKDVLRLKSELANVVEDYKVPMKFFSHMDFLISKKAPEAVYWRVIEAIKDVNKH